VPTAAKLTDCIGVKPQVVQPSNFTSFITAAPPAELYRGERLGLEFQRAASRLVEMQTQHYLAREHHP